MQNDSPDSPAVPLLDERYELSRRLREEPWGEVWLAQDRLLEVEVALKVLPRQAPEWSSASGYYAQEAALALRLRHPRILGVLHLEHTEECLFLVQEPFDGDSLLAHFVRQERFSLPQALHLLEQISQAVALAHQRGGVHHALNPLNILLKGEEVRVANFSFPNQDDGQVHTLELKAYDAPEVIYGDAPSEASNVFSLGVLGFRLVAGSLPYALTFDEPFPYRFEVLPADLEEIPLPLQNLLLRCLAVDPEERFPDAAAFLAQLRQVRKAQYPERPVDYPAWDSTSSGAAWKPAASRAGAVLGKTWALTQPLAQKAKDLAVRAGQAFMASPRRQLWGLGLAGLFVILIWVGVKLNRSTPAPPKVVPAASLAAAPQPPIPAGVPPLTEPQESAAAQMQPAARTASAPAPAAVPSGPSPESAKPKEDRYLLVAGSYPDQKKAKALLEKLKKDKFKAKITAKTVGGKTQYQVQLGPVTGNKAAEEMAKRIKSQEKINPRIIKMNAKSKPAKPAANSARRAAR